MIPPTSIDGTDITGATIDGTDVTEITVDGDTVFTSSLEGTFDITQVTFDTSINTQDSDVRDIQWNNDGTRLYEVGRNTLEIYQYTLSTPFEITTASHSTGDSISTQDTTPLGIAWNDDGSRLYEVGRDSNRIYQYSVSTPFDINTASFLTSISTQDNNSSGIAWNDDGSRLYEVGFGSDQIYQYTVSTPFDITTASHSSGDSINTQANGATGIAWNDDGSRLYEVDFFDAEIYQYTVSTPFEITSASFSTSITSQDSNPTGIVWNNNGSRFYESGSNSDVIYQYKL